MNLHMKHRVVIEAPMRTPDEAGGASVSWTTHATLWARIVASGGREVLRAGEIAPRVLYRVTLRHRTDISSAMRVNFAGKILEIDAVYDPEGEHRVLMLDCYEAGP